MVVRSSIQDQIVLAVGAGSHLADGQPVYAAGSLDGSKCVDAFEVDPVIVVDERGDACLRHLDVVVEQCNLRTLSARLNYADLEERLFCAVCEEHEDVAGALESGSIGSDGDRNGAAGNVVCIGGTYCRSCDPIRLCYDFGCSELVGSIFGVDGLACLHCAVERLVGVEYDSTVARLGYLDGLDCSFARTRDDYRERFAARRVGWIYGL